MAKPRIVEVQTNASALAAALGAVAAQQIPFASAQALTTLAFQAQREEKSELARAMTLRNRFSASGIQVNRAEKKDWPDQYAEVGVDERRSYLIDHVTGGKRQGGSHGRAILEKEGLRSKNGRIAKRNRPRALLKWAQKTPEGGRRKGSKNGQHSTPLPFLIYSSKWGNEVLVQRMGAERYPLQILYAFKRGVSIKPEFNMERIAADTVRGGYYAAFTKALARAIASGKSKGERQASRSRGQGIMSGR